MPLRAESHAPVPCVRRDRAARPSPSSSKPRRRAACPACGGRPCPKRSCDRNSSETLLFTPAARAVELQTSNARRAQAKTVQRFIASLPSRFPGAKAAEPFQIVGKSARRPRLRCGSVNLGQPTNRKPPFKYSALTRVGFSDTDAQGIVYYGRYLPYFDDARVEYLRHLGLLDADLRDCEFVMRASHVLYEAPARFDDLLEVFVRTKRIGQSSVTSEYAAYRVDDDALMCTAEQTHRPRRPGGAAAASGSGRLQAGRRRFRRRRPRARRAVMSDYSGRARGGRPDRQPRIRGR